MTTNVILNSELLERALALSAETSAQDVVTLALREFIARRGQRGLVDLFGTLDWDDSFDYKAQRTRL